MTSVRPRYLPLPYQDSAEAGRLILRDGTTATVRLAHPADCEAMGRFFASQSETSRIHRFFSLAGPGKKLIEIFCDDKDPRKQLTLVVIRSLEQGSRIIATGSYLARDETTAEVAMAVDDNFQGKGIGMLLLERLAVLAAGHGFRRFWAVTMADNQPMLDVFRSSGFEVQTNRDSGFVEVDLSVVPTHASITEAEMRDRVSTTASLRPFFYPKSVAVVGASQNPRTIGARVLHGLINAGYRGMIYPINPRAAVIASLTAYPSVKVLPEAPDLAIITVPKEAVLEVIDDCGSRGVRAVVVITAGFAETGDEGRKVQDKLVEKVRGHGMRMVGPNCLGLINADPAANLNASFSPLFPIPGKIAFSSQSGALGLAILSLLRDRRLGLAQFISVGNKADVSGNDLLQYWEENNQIDVVLLYLESFGNPRRFARIARRIGHRKPIVVVKAGRTGAGRRAAGSHTAALAANDVAVDALFRQTGVIRAETLDEMFDLAAALSQQPLPKGRRIAILTNAGGLGILCADSCEAGNLNVPELSETVQKALREFLPAAAGVANPVDMIASATPDQFRKAIEILLLDDHVDALIILYIDVALADNTAIADAIAGGVAAARKQVTGAKPVYACMMASSLPTAQTDGNRERVPNFPFPETPARLLSKLMDYCEWRNKAEGIIPDFDDIQPDVARGVCRSMLSQRGPGWLSGEEVRPILSAFALPQLPGGICFTADEAAQKAVEVGFPVAVKLSSPHIIHKTEVGGVQLNLQSEAEVRQAFAAIQEQVATRLKASSTEPVIVQPMISGGIELMIGVTEDPSFGPLLAFGLGGIHVEILRDVCFRVTPITDQDAQEMIKTIRGYRLLEGYRGHPPADIPAIEQVLLRVARLVEEVPEISELELNPIMALSPGQGCRIVDARIKAGREKQNCNVGTAGSKK